MARKFEDRAATREQTPLMIGLVGPSGAGKTYSALRLATGFQRVTGGDIYVIDTEARRALHYADSFTFRHLAFGAPFGSLDYLDAIEHCVAKGASTIIVDSMSHEHEGPGGVLEQHDAELTRMGGQLSKSMLAWARPKANRRRMISGILQVPCNFIFCFRAKEKLKIQPGKEPVPMGFMPIAGEELVFEMTMNALLLPGSEGVPTWRSDQIGERLVMKLPRQFESLFSSSPQLSEHVGAEMAQWAKGGAVETIDPATFVERYAVCTDAATFRSLEAARALAWDGLAKDAKADVKAASDRCATVLKSIAEAVPPGADDSAEPEAA